MERDEPSQLSSLRVQTRRRFSYTKAERRGKTSGEEGEGRKRTERERKLIFRDRMNWAERRKRKEGERASLSERGGLSFTDPPQTL